MNIHYINKVFVANINDDDDDILYNGHVHKGQMRLNQWYDENSWRRSIYICTPHLDLTSYL